MLRKLINHSSDLRRLIDEGYEIETESGYIALHGVPYVASDRSIKVGTLVTNLSVNADRVQAPSDHQVWFCGEMPCDAEGVEIAALGQRRVDQTLFGNCVASYRFSCKPPGGYPDYYEKLTRYVEIISNPAKAINPEVTAQSFKPFAVGSEDVVFHYIDSASSRVGITELTAKLAMHRVAIVGLGGTGSYILDLIAKTPIREIHIFDGDHYFQHNAFRSPGAPSLGQLEEQQSKVDYFADLYSKMHRGIVTHLIYLDEENVHELKDFDFVFICVDNTAARVLLSRFLRDQLIPFIDTGMDLELINEEQCLIGTCRTTLSEPEMSGHFSKHVSLEQSVSEDIYSSNIQVADLNSLNATLAVIKWKKYCGFYQDCYGEHQSVYVLNTHQLTRDETKKKKVA